MSPTEPRVPTTGPSQAPGRILIVDDLEANLIALESILEDLGVPLVRAKSGREAIAKLLEQSFALVIMDVRMPDMDGLAAIQMMRGYRQLKEVPVILVSSFEPTPPELDRGYALWAAD